MKRFEDIFTKSKLMITSGILGTACFLFLTVTGIITAFPGTVHYALLSLLIIALLVCYKKGETSAQKALSGAILGVLLQFFLVGMTGAYGNENIIIGIIEMIVTVAIAVIFINHMLLQIDHKGDKKVVIVSQIVLIITFLAQVTEFVLQILSKENMYYNKIHSFGVLCLITLIICMESKIQKYKAKRAEGMSKGTWTEEERQKYKKIFKF